MHPGCPARSDRPQEAAGVAELSLWAGGRPHSGRSIRLGGAFFAIRASRRDRPMGSLDRDDLVRWT
jgi:hypothetical protein